MKKITSPWKVAVGLGALISIATMASASAEFRYTSCFMKDVSRMEYTTKTLHSTFISELKQCPRSWPARGNDRVLLSAMCDLKDYTASVACNFRSGYTPCTMDSKVKNLGRKVENVKVLALKFRAGKRTMSALSNTCKAFSGLEDGFEAQQAIHNRSRYDSRDRHDDRHYTSRSRGHSSRDRHEAPSARRVSDPREEVINFLFERMRRR